MVLMLREKVVHRDHNAFNRRPSGITVFNNPRLDGFEADLPMPDQNSSQPS